MKFFGFKLKLLHKIFLANLSIILLLSLVLLTLSYASFRHMSTIINDSMLREEARLMEQLAPAIATYFQHRQSWREFEKQPEKWHQFLKRYLKTEPFIGPALPKNQRQPRENRLFPHGIEPPPRIHMKHFASRISLLDADKNEVVTAQHSGASIYSVNIKLSGQSIAWLTLSEAREVHKRGDMLLGKQLERIMLIALIGVLLSGVVSFYLAKHFTAPINKLTQQASLLANRDFYAKVNINSADELAQLGKSFNQVANNLASFENQQKQWLQDIAHELRTPLTVIRGELEAMNDGVIEASKQNINLLLQEVLRLNRLIEDLHELAVTDNLDLMKDATSIRLDKRLYKIAERFRIKLAKRGISLNIDLSSCLILGDDKRLEQVFVNILENNNKYTQEQGKVWLSLTVSEKDCVVSIEDSGPGIAKEQLPKLFDRLYRLDEHRNREIGGAGLGLSICHNIISAHGGTIEATQSSKGGLLVRITLPNNFEH